MEPTIFDLIEFQRRLGEASAWYRSKAPLADAEHSLRTAALAPPAGLKTPTELVWPDPPLPWSGEMMRGFLARSHRDWPQILKERQAIVDEVVRKRRTALSAAHVDVPQMGSVQTPGRLMIYYPDRNLADGAALTASQGFFNLENMPPWDTWVFYNEESQEKEEDNTYLLAWVPPECLELATAGIRVNPELCICWAEDLETKFVRQLRSAGLIR